MKGGPSSRGRESLSLLGGEAISPEQTRTRQPRQINSYASTQQAAQTLKAELSASSPAGVLVPPDTSTQAPHALLAALDLHLTPQQR